MATGDDLLDAMSALRRALRRDVERPAELARLTSAQLQLLRVVRLSPGISVADAASELRVAPNTVSTLVRQLVEADVLVRRVDPHDRRVGRLDLKPGVRRKVEAWRRHRTEMVGRAVASLTPTERRRLEQALPVLVTVAEALE
ncbi:MAG TPA: MarR family winged helix-turn-helix transcriptional regulator [Gaiellaceae bacterium]|nr:MarR family winged helix-turn-helix transcriptional regulator [Gaiellaceae bacterium]